MQGLRHVCKNIDLIGLVTTHVGSPQGIDVFQDARLLTLSWPYYPKVVSCVEAMAEQQ